MAKQFQQLDLFFTLGADVSVRGKQDLMARNWFSLGKRKRTTAIEHRFDDDWIKITGNDEYGIATIYDNDLLIFLISQLNEAKNRGDTTGQRIRFTGYEFWTFVGKKRTGGKGYTDLWRMMERLHHTFVETSIRQGERRRHHSFNWLSEIQQITENGRSVGFEVVLCEWMYKAILDNKLILSIDSDYFQATSGLERWLYLFCRKTSGHQRDGWSESFDSIYKKSGALTSKKDFNKALRKIITEQSISHYTLDEDVVADGNRGKWHSELSAKRSYLK
jgi:plasmid replication initiation protein